MEKEIKIALGSTSQHKIEAVKQALPTTWFVGVCGWC